ncbi:ThuA domain-containing protein [Sphingomonas sp.]|uniref:ThuA domain-containing protein n=1 Tax=Sphingomonas sp. TaxID=28214 RepID=UPI002EDAE493
MIDRRTLLAATALLAAAPAMARGWARPLRVLIIDGYGNHDWRLTTRLFRAIVEPTGLFHVTVSTAPETAADPRWAEWRPAFAGHDVVVQTTNDLGGRPTWPASVRGDFEAFVRNGGGVLFLHSANNAFADWPAYNRMIGLGWRSLDFGPSIEIVGGKPRLIPAGVGEKTGHGARSDALVTRIGDHPIHRGLPRSWRTADVEIYRYPRGPARVKILSYAHDAKTGRDWPMEWTTRFGRGRCYTASYGHVWKGDVDPPTLRSADVQTILIRALLWLGGRTPPSAAPADFPGKDAVSLRPPLAM